MSMARMWIRSGASCCSSFVVFYHNHRIAQLLQFFQILFTPASQSEYPSFLEQLQGRFFSDTGSSPYDEGTLYRFFIHQLVRIS